MRLKTKSLNFLVNFLLGISWATALVGAITSFFTYYFSDGLLFASISFFIGAIPGMIGVLLLELFLIQYLKYTELQKQTKLLEELLSLKKNEALEC